MNYKIRNKIPNSMCKLLEIWRRENKNITSDSRILIYLASNKFNIHRLPTYMDRQSVDISTELINKYFGEDKSSINNRINALLNDFDVLYDNTQNRLKEKYGNVKEIILSRCITKKPTEHSNCSPDISTLINYINFSKRNGDDIELEMDILNSWSNIPSSNYGSVKLTKGILLEDILFFNDKDDECNGGYPLEIGEYIVINREITGIISFEPNNVKVDKELDSFSPLESRYYKPERRKPYTPPYLDNDEKINLFRDLYYVYKCWKNK